MGCLVLENIVLSAMYFNGTKITENNSEHTFVISRDMFCVQCISMEKIVFVFVLWLFSVFRETAQNSRVKIIYSRHLNVKSLFTNNDIVEVLYFNVFEDEKAKIYNFHATVLCCFAKHRDHTENSHKTKQNNLFH